MAAQFKSHILLRDEKGLFGIPFKRLLGAGVGAIMIFMISRMVVSLVSLPIGLVAFVLIIVLTSPQGGLPLYLRLWYRGRGLVMIRAARRPQSIYAQIADIFALPVEMVVLNGDAIYAPPSQAAEVNLAEWETYSTPLEGGDGLVILNEAWILAEAPQQHKRVVKVEED